MATLNFTVAYATTLDAVQSLTPNTTIYAEDLGNCSPCVTDTGSCWACLATSQGVFTDSGLTSSVADGYYMLKYTEDKLPAVWHIVGGFPQEGGFYN
jgi:hypothetical protein